MKHLILFMLALMILAAPLTGVLAEETRGFDTSEACAQAVVNALIQMNMDAFLDCYAIPEVARQYNFEAVLGKYRLLTIGNMLLPPTSNVNVCCNEASLTDDLAIRVFGSAFILENSDAESLWGIVLKMEDRSMEEMTALVSGNDALTLLEFQRFADPSELNENYVNTIGQRVNWYCTMYSTQAWEETVAVLGYKEQTVYLPLALVQYSGKWLAMPVQPIASLLYGVPNFSLLITEDML